MSMDAKKTFRPIIKLYRDFSCFFFHLVQIFDTFSITIQSIVDINKEIKKIQQNVLHKDIFKTAFEINIAFEDKYRLGNSRSCFFNRIKTADDVIERD